MTRTPTVATLTGLVDLMAPDPATITLDAIAHQLGQINRYCGALELPFSVAQHSVLTFEIFRRRCPDLPAMHALLHDAPEYVWGDETRPRQEAAELHFPGYRRWLESMQHRMLVAIRQRFGIPAPTIEVLAAVAEADDIALATEWRAYMPRPAGPCPIAAQPMRGITPKPLPWAAAADLFKETFRRELHLVQLDRAVEEVGY